MLENAPNLDHLENEPDVDVRQTGIVLLLTLAITGAFFLSVFALYTYFQWEVDNAMSAKVLSVGGEQLQELRAQENAALSGQGPAKLSIEAAMKAVASEAAGQ